jgi:glycosyltransferase involved in cell wall biosynthesis
MAVPTNGASVLIRAHLDSPYLYEALKSVARQSTTFNVEILIGLDRPTQLLMRQLEKFKTEFPNIEIQYFELSDIGIATRLNVLASKSSFEFLFILDSDDRMAPNRIETQVKFLRENENYAAVGSAISIINQSGVKIGEKGFSTDKDRIRVTKYSHLPLAHPAASILKSSLIEVGGYRDFFFPSEDYDLWLRLLEQFELGNLSEILTEYRVHESQATGTRFFRNNAAAIAAETSSKSRTSGKLEVNELYEDPQAWAKRSPKLPRIILLSSRAYLWHRAKKEITKKNYLKATTVTLLILILQPYSGGRELLSKFHHRNLFTKIN